MPSYANIAYFWRFFLLELNCIRRPLICIKEVPIKRKKENLYMNEIVVGVMGILGTVSSICFAYLAFRRNQHLDTKKDAKTEGVLISDVGYIKSSIDRMEQKLDRVEENYHSLLARIVKVEQAQSALEKRLEHSNQK